MTTSTLFFFFHPFHTHTPPFAISPHRSCCRLFSFFTSAIFHPSTLSAVVVVARCPAALTATRWIVDDDDDVGVFHVSVLSSVGDEEGGPDELPTISLSLLAI
uniref:Uncharacterized protein n=1 Tax=Plectus sambesii TaxID=2011161 RepID=A0A914XHU4_9BILA